MLIRFLRALKIEIAAGVRVFLPLSLVPFTDCLRGRGNRERNVEKRVSMSIGKIWAGLV
jgi:hypothetical protein